MKHFHFFKLFNNLIKLFIFYNIFCLIILFYPSLKVNEFFWKITPYDYKQLVNNPVNLFTDSNYLKNENITVTKLLKRNENRNAVSSKYWNYNFIIDHYNKTTNKDNKSVQKSFLNFFILTNNDFHRNTELKKYYIKNYSFFSEKNKKKIRIYLN